MPADLYGPLAVRCAVVTAHGAGNPEAARYIAFLSGIPASPEDY